MTGRGRHEGSIARHKGGGSVFSCVVPYRFRHLAEGGRSGTAGEGSADCSRPRYVVKPGAGRQTEISDREVLAGRVRCRWCG